MLHRSTLANSFQMLDDSSNFLFLKTFFLVLKRFLNLEESKKKKKKEEKKNILLSTDGTIAFKLKASFESCTSLTHQSDWHVLLQTTYKPLMTFTREGIDFFHS